MKLNEILKILVSLPHQIVPSLNHNSTDVSFYVSLVKKLPFNNRRFVHKTVSIMLKIVSETFEDNYKVESSVTVEIRTVDGT